MPGPVPERTARAYRRSGNTLANRVTRQMALHPELPRFLGGRPRWLLDVNHFQHAGFMAEVLYSGDRTLLERTLPWVYAAYIHQGVHPDYFQAELEAWMRVIPEVLAPEDAGAVLPWYRWMLARHGQTLQEALHREAEQMPVPPGLEADHDFLLERLLQGDHDAVLARCRQFRTQGMGYHRLMQDLFYPVMVEVGARWERGHITVDMEHQITAMVYRILSTLYCDQSFPEANRGRAVVSPVSNEFHEMGAWMLACALELEGWDVTLLSADCPPERLVATVRAQQPHFLALSVTLVVNVEEARRAIAGVRDLPEAAGMPIVVGGRAFLEAPALGEKVGADRILEDCDAAVRWARTLEPGRAA
ncbi:cobalamin B12-binding domain-containing protein [Ectothiorhodospira mobilis]|uniref:cobalamin B12-binding domain-containing protein n=1 Tax=Ectothiorhodospira mobilis TaxID=195064 RepID=UPI0030B82BFB